MLEGVYNIGLIKNKGSFLDNFIEEIEALRNKYIFKIVFDITKLNGVKYKEISYEETSNDKKLKYLYKKGSANGSDYTPTSKITSLNKTYEKKFLKSIESFIKEHKEALKLNYDNLLFLESLNNEIKKNKDNIYHDLYEFINKQGLLKEDKKENDFNIIDGGVLTIVFIDENQKDEQDAYIEKYIGDLDFIVNVFTSNEEDSYKGFYEKYNTTSIAKDKLCYICKKTKPKVWGFVSTYPFYTCDKTGLISGGFSQKEAYKNYPVCSECAVKLEYGKDYIDDNLSFRFCGFNYLLIPQLVINDNNILQDILNKLSKYKSFSLGNKEKDDEKILLTEEAILEDLAEEGNYVNFNFIFFEKNNAAYNILLRLDEVPPSRLNYLITVKKEIDKQKRKYNIFEKIVITPKNKPSYQIDFDFRFKFIREFFLSSNIEGVYDKDFLNILNDIFIGNKISYQFLLNRFMAIIRSNFLNSDNFPSISMLKAYKVIMYLEQIELLNRIKGDNMENVKPYNDFFTENKIFDDDTKKAVFLEGVLADKLLYIQYQERNAKPFQTRLNGLKIDEKIAKRLLPEMINKLEEYGKNYQSLRDLEEAISLYMLNSDFKKYSIDEISFYFSLGLSLSKQFVKEEKEEIIK